MRRALAVLVGVGFVASGIGVPATAQQERHVISEDTTWTKDQSPMAWTIPVFIERGATLTVEPGVRFDGQAIEVAGALVARGTEAEPIVFAGLYGERWDGISFHQDAAPASAIEHAVVENALRGIYMSVAAFPIHDTEFRGNVVGLQVSNPETNLTFTGNEFYSNDTAFRGRTHGLIGLFENDFWDNDLSLFFEAQSPYDCDRDPGIFEVHYNDILRGPDSEWFAFDVRASAGSGTSRMAINASENWWGTTDEDDIDARVFPSGERCCPINARAPVHWKPPANVPQTPTVPPGEVGTPSEQPSVHGDPDWITRVTSPDDRGCFGPRSVTEVKGRAYPGLGEVPDRVGVALLRIAGKGRCRSWRPDERRFGEARSCSRPYVIKVPVRTSRSGRESWRVRLPRPLPPGRYWVRSGLTGGVPDEARFRVFR